MLKGKTASLPLLQDYAGMQARQGFHLLLFIHNTSLIKLKKSYAGEFPVGKKPQFI